MIPVAGRRKGTSPLPASCVPPPPSSSLLSNGNEPNWLFGDDIDSVAEKTNITCPPSAAFVAQNTLSFLDFEDELPVPSSSASPTTVFSPPLQSQMVHPSVILRNHQEELQKELQQVQEELLLREKHIRLLESGEDESCLDVRSIETKACIKREGVDRGAVMQEEAEEILELRRWRLQEEGDEYQRKELANVSKAIRMKYESDVGRLRELVEQQHISLLSVRERHKGMDTAICTKEPYELALAQLEKTLKASVHDMGSDMYMRVKPVLVQNIRDSIVQSAQQRLDILSNDRRRRREEWESFQQTMKKEFSNFQERRRAQHQAGFDLFFGDAVTKAQSSLDNRLTTLTQYLAERQRKVMAESHLYTQRAINEMVQRSEEELNAMERRHQEELKRTDEQYAAELAHHARLCTAEKEAATHRPRRHEEEEKKEDTALSTLYRSVEKKLMFLRERVEQLQQSVSFSMRELSSAASRCGSETLSVRERELMLEECERRTRQVSHQLSTQWQRFLSAVAPLEECVSSMDGALREGRVKVSTMLQAVESVYHAWCHDVRRELSRCLTAGVVPLDAGEIESGVVLMTQVMEKTLAQLQPLRAVYHEARVNQKSLWSEVEQELAALSKKRDSSDDALCSVFDVYDRLARAAAEVEAKRNLLEVAEGDYTAARQLLERERADFSERLEEVRHLGASLRRETARLEDGTALGGYKGYRSHVLRDSTAEGERRLKGVRAPLCGTQRRMYSPGCGKNMKRSLGRPVREGGVVSLPKNECTREFGSLLSVDDSGPQTLPFDGSDEYEDRQKFHGPDRVLFSDCMHVGGESRSLTTPSTSNT